MKLVKDITERGVVLYWIGPKAKKLSQEFHCMNEAEEWWRCYHFTLYQGEERRVSIHDRRKNDGHRDQFDLNRNLLRLNPNGRRFTDRPIKVDVDLFKLKLKLKKTS